MPFSPSARATAQMSFCKKKMYLKNIYIFIKSFGITTLLKTNLSMCITELSFFLTSAPFFGYKTTGGVPYECL